MQLEQQFAAFRRESERTAERMQADFRLVYEYAQKLAVIVENMEKGYDSLLLLVLFSCFVCL